MRVQTQFSIFVINQPGVLAQVTSALAHSGVNVMALSLSDSGEHGVLRVVSDDANKTRKVLQGAHDRWTETDVLTLRLPNTPGSFAAAARALAEAHVNISYTYLTGAVAGETSTAIFKVADIHKARKALEGLFGQEESSC